MNKSKFLKKSLAAVLAVLLIVAMIPLSAAAADTPPSIFVDHEEVYAEGNSYSVKREIDPSAVYLGTNYTLDESVMVMIAPGSGDEMELQNEGSSSTNFDLNYWATKSGNIYTIKLEWRGDDKDGDGVRQKLGDYTLTIDNSPGAPSTDTGINRVNLTDENDPAGDAEKIYDPSAFDITTGTVLVTLPFGTNIPNELLTDMDNTTTPKAAEVFEPANSGATVTFTAKTGFAGNYADGKSVTVGVATVEVAGQIQNYDVKVKWQPGFSSFEIEGQESVEIGTNVTGGGIAKPYITVTMPFGTGTGKSTRIKPTFTLGDTISKGVVKINSENRPLTSGMTFPQLDNDSDHGYLADGSGTIVGGQLVDTTPGAANAGIIRLVRKNYAATDSGSSYTNAKKVLLTVKDVSKNAEAKLTKIQVQGLDNSAQYSNEYELAQSGTTTVELPKSFAATTNKNQGKLLLEGSLGATVSVVEDKLTTQIGTTGKQTLSPVTILETNVDKNKTVRIRVTSEDGHTIKEYPVVFKKAAEEKAILQELVLKGKDAAGNTVRAAITSQYRAKDDDATVVEIKVPYTWMLEDSLKNVEVFALASTGAAIKVYDTPANPATGTVEFDLFANRGAKIGKADGSEANTINATTTGVSTVKWTNANLFQIGTQGTNWNPIKITVRNENLPADKQNNTYIVKLIADKATARTGRVFNGASEVTDQSKYSSVTADNTFTMTPGTANDQGRFSVNTLELKVPHSYTPASSRVLYGLNFKTYDGAVVLINPVPTAANDSKAFFKLDPKYYGDQSGNVGTNLTLPVGSTTDGLKKWLTAYNADTRTIDTTKAAEIWVVSEKGWVDSTYSDGVLQDAEMKTLVDDKLATKYYLYATRAEAETGHELLSMESTLDSNVEVNFDKTARIIDIDVPSSYANGTKTFSLNFATSKLASVTFEDDANDPKYLMKSDLGSKETVDCTQFTVTNAGVLKDSVNNADLTAARVGGSSISKGTLLVTNEKGDFTSRYTVRVTVSTVQQGAEITSLKAAGTSASITGTDISLTLPVGTDLKSQKLDIKASRMAKILINGVAYSPDKNYNLNSPLTIKVTSESGTNNNTYKLTTKTATGFTDVKSTDWFYSYVNKAVEEGIVLGIGDNKFGPYTNITRQDFAVMTVRMLGVAVDDKLTIPYTDSDKISEYARNAVAYCAANKILSGYEDMTFRPQQNITREEAAKILAVALKLEVTGATTFADNARIQSWAVPYVAACQKAGVFNGDEANRFNPQQKITRAETAKVMVDSLKIKK